MAHRVDTSTAVAVMPAPGAAGTPGYFSAGDPQTGTPATVPGFAFFNMIQEEVVNVVEGAGLTLDKNDNTQLLQAINTKAFGVVAAQTVSDVASVNLAHTLEYGNIYKLHCILFGASGGTGSFRGRINGAVQSGLVTGYYAIPNYVGGGGPYTFNGEMIIGDVGDNDNICGCVDIYPNAPGSASFAYKSEWFYTSAAGQSVGTCWGQINMAVNSIQLLISDSPTFSGKFWLERRPMP